MWFCTFFDHHHRVLRTATGSERPEEARSVGLAILGGQAHYELIDVDRQVVGAGAVDRRRGFTIEPDHV